MVQISNLFKVVPEWGKRKRNCPEEITKLEKSSPMLETVSGPNKFYRSQMDRKVAADLKRERNTYRQYLRKRVATQVETPDAFCLTEHFHSRTVQPGAGSRVRTKHIL